MSILLVICTVEPNIFITGLETSSTCCFATLALPQNYKSFMTFIEWILYSLCLFLFDFACVLLFRLKSETSWRTEATSSVFALPHQGCSYVCLVADIHQGLLVEFDILSLYLSVIFGKFRRILRGLINLFIFIVGNLSNERFRNVVKLIFGWEERRKLMTEIWEGPVEGLVSSTVCFVEEGKGSQPEGTRKGKINKKPKSSL